LIGLGLSGDQVEDEDLLIGAVTPVLDLARAPAAHALSAGLLPLASRAGAAVADPPRDGHGRRRSDRRRTPTPSWSPPCWC
jgi:hypothetical protein